MKNNNLHIENDIFLAKWMVEEITDTELKKLISEKDFLAYTKLKKGILLYEKLEEPLGESFKKVQNKIENGHFDRLNDQNSDRLNDQETNKFNESKSKVRKLNSKWIIFIAASILLLFSINIFLKNKSVLNQTNFGEQKVIALLDGSEVILSAKSEISYNINNWKNSRELFLDGKAFFKVKKGSKFTVKTNNGEIQVLGTQFNVNSKKDFFEVICYSGKVKVTNNDSTYVLTPSQGFRKVIGNDFENLSTKQITPTWVSGESNYKSIPIKYVILDLEKQFNVKFKTTKIDTNLLFTGSFSHKDKQLAFTTVFRAMDLSYKEIDTKTLELVKSK